MTLQSNKGKKKKNKDKKYKVSCIAPVVISIPIIMAIIQLSKRLSSESPIGGTIKFWLTLSTKLQHWVFIQKTLNMLLLNWKVSSVAENNATRVPVVQQYYACSKDFCNKDKCFGRDTSLFFIVFFQSISRKFSQYLLSKKAEYRALANCYAE